MDLFQDSTLTCCPFERTASAGFRADEGELKSGALRVAVAALAGVAAIVAALV